MAPALVMQAFLSVSLSYPEHLPQDRDQRLKNRQAEPLVSIVYTSSKEAFKASRAPPDCWYSGLGERSCNFLFSYKELSLESPHPELSFCLKSSP